MPIFLVGFMGCGKTELGQMLALRLGLPFFDTDLLLEEKLRLPISEIFKTKGEVYFRLHEADLIRAYVFPEKSLISTGGGLPCFHQNMDYLLSRGTVVYLEASANLLTAYLTLSEERRKRPLLQECGSLVQIQKKVSDMLQERVPFYRRAPLKLSIVEDREQQYQEIEKLIKELSTLSFL